MGFTGASGLFDDCGNCLDYSTQLCDAIEMEYPCHAWENDEEGPAPRCEDPHIFGGDQYYFGDGSCSEEHPAPCWSPSCAGEDLEENLAAAVSALDVVALENLLATTPQAWVEVNEDRMALQILARCAENPVGGVVLHFPVTNEGVSFWASAISGSGLSAPSESRDR